MDNQQNELVDHLFRHHYGKMIASLVKIFGLSNLELVEDAVQDTFIQAFSKWQIEVPTNPEGWLTRSAKNRAIDLLRKINSDSNREVKAIPFEEDEIEEIFLEHEIEDAQLKMIFTACHPELNERDQIAFALKSIGGFSDKEIASALLLKIETVKKRISRARKQIKEKNIQFELPNAEQVLKRIFNVNQILYLIFNEGFHSAKSETIVRSELCSEAMRLNRMILKKESLRTGEGYALMALFCFHASRLESKYSDNNVLIDLRNQNRVLWNEELIKFGEHLLMKSIEFEDFSNYHLEAKIAFEHCKANSFDNTNWQKILKCHEIIQKNTPNDLTLLNMAIVQIQLREYEQAEKSIKKITPKNLESRIYLYHGTKAELYEAQGNHKLAKEEFEKAFATATNVSEKEFLKGKIN